MYGHLIIVPLNARDTEISLQAHAYPMVVYANLTLPHTLIMIYTSCTSSDTNWHCMFGRRLNGYTSLKILAFHIYISRADPGFCKWVPTIFEIIQAHSKASYREGAKRRRPGGVFKAAQQKQILPRSRSVLGPKNILRF